MVQKQVLSSGAGQKWKLGAHILVWATLPIAPAPSAAPLLMERKEPHVYLRRLSRMVTKN